MIIDNSLERKLLVVPFNDDYYVNELVKELLTDEEFFDKCFLKPDFDKQIEELKSISSSEVQAFDIDLPINELISKYDSFNSDLENFYNWINTNQNELYCIKGDAGTGKSTFLHYLKYKYRDKNIIWDIVDIQEAIDRISFLGHSIEFKEFQNLYCKAISAILVCLKNEFFVLDVDNNMDFIASRKKLSELVKGYNYYFSKLFPDEKVNKFFNKISEIENTNCDEKTICCKFAKFIQSYIIELLSYYEDNYSELFSIILEWFIFVTVSQNYKKRHIISFDNFERFIGTDEIYSFQLTQFVSRLRNIQNHISDNLPVLAKNFQIVIFMRNTSTRMFTPQQVSEITAHSLDLSEWFQSSKIIEKKITWYNEKNIDVNGANIIQQILHDIGGGDNCVRGLRTKLNMIFNYNKRIIVRFLIMVISITENEEYIRKYVDFWDNRNRKNYNLDYSHSHFAARMIIFRLILNRLRYDEFFKNIIVQKSKSELYSLGYARKILTILYDYKLRNEKNPYMNFSDILLKLYNTNDCVNTYFDSNNSSIRHVISQVLFYMNYYNVRLNNWLQFIDIQYNVSPQRVIVDNCEKLESLILSDYENIKIRITNAGIAYLYFVIPSFEYFACKSIYSPSKDKIFGNGDLPPIMAVIPDKDEIMTKKTDNITCLKVIKAVFNEASACLNKMAANTNNIDFRYDDKNTYISHSKRIIDTHTGFLGNYKYCIKEININEYKSNPHFANKLDNLLKKIDNIIDGYKQYE